MCEKKEGRQPNMCEKKVETTECVWDVGKKRGGNRTCVRKKKVETTECVWDVGKKGGQPNEIGRAHV